VRENGGQYTHAAIWVVMPLAEMDPGGMPGNCFDMLNPINHARDRDQSDTYRVEPYVVAAAIYGEGQLTGRGGWTWYTGSAGSLYRVVVEGILGIRVKNGRLFVKPAPAFELGRLCGGHRTAERKLPYFRLKSARCSDILGHHQ